MICGKIIACYSYNVKRFYTLAIARQDNQILLARKARGFGAGVWNGFGGKVEGGETIEEAAVRECQEEAGITPSKLYSRGVLAFHYEATGHIHLTRIFEVASFTGMPTATEEMKDPTWFPVEDIPYTQMWPDDRFWMPLLIARRQFTGQFFFNVENMISEYDLEEVYA